MTPYDVPSYFFMALGIILFLKQIETNSTPYLALLCAVIALATLTRESSLIILCFMAAVYITRFGLMNMRWIRKMVWPALAFFIPYFGLRFFFGGSMQNIRQVTFLTNFELNRSKTPMALIFFAFLLYFCFQLAGSKENRKLVRTFLLLSTPYIVMIFVVGLIIEIRLWMPLMIGSAVLAFINYHAILKSEPESGSGLRQAKPRVSA